jgi:hypothetical protein
MTATGKLAPPLFLAMIFFTGNAQADIYKCTDADGNVMYSQTPCKKQSSEKTNSTGPKSAEVVDCSFAGRFAIVTARYMRAGSRSDEVFNRYGGLDSLSKASIGVINYVYSFRTNADISEERIAGLAQARCRARSFGDVSCEALPRSFIEGLGGCDAQELEEPRGEPEPGAEIATTARANDSRSEELIQQCKKRYRDQIDVIDAEMRRGYSSAQGETYRERLRVLTQQLRRC